jgi:3-hydroxyacyl-[acyl-carrier-protein] dehydratase
MNDNFFQGHFPEKPVMPGVLIVEAMAQTAGCIVVDSMGKEGEGKLVYFMSIEGAKFRKPVGPGDVLQLRCEAAASRKNVWKFSCEAYVENTKVAEATITAMIMV